MDTINNPYKNTGAIHTDKELDSYLESLQSQRRILISEMNDATDSGNLSKRSFILDKVIDIEHEIHKHEPPIQKAPDTVRLVNLKKELIIPQIRAKQHIDTLTDEEKQELKQELITSGKILRRDFKKPWWKFW